MPAIYASYPGVQHVLSANYTRTQGVTPSAAVIVCTPQRDLPETHGVLKFVDHLGDSVSFPDFRLDEASLEFDESGQLVSFSLLDRRWQWANQWITYYANIRRPTAVNFYNLVNQQSLRSLVWKLLEAMDYRGAQFDFFDGMDDLYPEVRWEHANPALELANLLRRVDGVVALRNNNDIYIAKRGSGQELPDSPRWELKRGSGHRIANLPEAIRIAGSPNQHQIDVQIEAVGMDTDGFVKPLNELSYCPVDEDGVKTWKRTHPDFRSLPDPITRSLARATVYKWYRIHEQPLGPDEGQLTIPGHGVVTRRGEILPLMATRVQQNLTNDGQLSYLHPIIYGFFNTLADDARLNVTEKSEDSNYPSWNDGRARFTDGFEIDVVQGIVKFSRQVFVQTDVNLDDLSPGIRDDIREGVGSTKLIQPGKMILRTGCYLTDWSTNAPVFFTHERIVDRQGYGTLVVREPALYARYWPTYELDKNMPGPTLTDAVEINRQARTLLERYQAALQARSTKRVVYSGIFNIEVNGLVQQVSWRIGPDGAFTEGSENTEFDPAIPPQEERIFFERLRRQETALREGLTPPFPLFT